MLTYDELKAVEEAKDGSAVPVVLTVEEEQERGMDIVRMQSAKEQRDKSQKEFDGMDYLTWYETNAQADMSFIPPKLNKEDVRVVTGTTRERDNSLLASLLNYNFEATVTAFDVFDNQLTELGSSMEDLTRKSREIEDYDSKRELIYRELLTQGDAFVMEEWIQRTKFDKRAKFNWKEGVRISDFELDVTLKMDFERAEVSLLPGTKVYMGNVKEPLLPKQPYLFTAETIPYDDVLQRFMHWERWRNVPKHILRMQDTMDATGYRDWTLLPTKDRYVEKLMMMDKPGNRFQIYLNGVPMLPKGFPLTEVSPSGEYPMIKGSIERVPFFAYSKGIPAKTKVEQAVMDEMLKLAVLKSQQGYRPPKANNTGRELSASIFTPGTIHNDIDVENLKNIVEPTGVTQSDLMFLDYMKSVVDSKSVSASFSGEKTKGRLTATEIMELKKQQLMKLGLVVWGVVQMEKEMNWLRIYTVCDKWTEKVDQRVPSLSSGMVSAYRRVTVDATLDGGQRGKRVYEFNKDKANALTGDQLQIEEELASLREGVPVRKTYINPEVLRSIKVHWRVNVVPTEKDTSDLHRVLFIQNLKDAATLFGPQSVNMDYAKQRFATLIKENPNKFFLKPELQQGRPGVVGEVGGQIADQIQKGVPQPSLKQLAATK